MPYDSKEKQKEYNRNGRRPKVEVYCRCGGTVQPFSTDLVTCTKCKREYLIVRRAHKAQLFPVKPESEPDDGWVAEVERLLQA